MAESFENLDTILRDWTKDIKLQKKLFSRHWTGTRSRKKKDKAVFLLENDSEKYSSSLSRQSSNTKPITKLVLVSREPVLYLEFSEPNKQMFMRLIYLKKIFSRKIIVDTLIDVRNETSKHDFLKSVKINT